ncbi:MAG TPA: phosphoribosylamine--glycine ligase [Chloroflexota bacterium]|nr:phosphoribosylamine--glycine ligase [Chloroflexota bacterium]HUM72017.1 phosphoribosylamine--glycine ligase [Chloroflexota bacterium]
MIENISVLVIGSGGREHALAWKLGQSPLVGKVYVAPGNAGTGLVVENVPIAEDDFAGLISFAQEKGIGLTAVGPEVPLANGIVDQFQAAGLPIFGPTQAAAQLEASKAFAKMFMQEMGIPTAKAAMFTHYEEARDYLAQNPGPVVIKASGLAAGKGVIVCDDTAQAETALQEIMLDRAFGTAGDEVLIEERMAGPELSLLVLTDGVTAVPLLPARDHKRIYDGDQGPNTGGMGAYAPPPDVTPELIEEIMATIVRPTIRGMAERGTPYVGVLYVGLMLTSSGPQVIEFNCRFGDPETQVVLPMLDGDLAEIMLACIEGRLSPEMVRFHSGACVTLVLAASGYPGPYPKGLPITGLDAVPDDVLVFHAGTKMENGQIVTNGGRVLAVSARGEGLSTAVDRVYTAIPKIHFDGVHYRRDIGR